ncbi:hypothetical protein FCIRC_7466 [Fusarium circinatum]|uniref:BTB domain-containing protein n=1 Tax=Fusarium circinatum TaxID=48490 RepID=A0A8H5WU11_FUSCI|nr:hypothetical protein FCIRC_7466 [Fusarium circinatum]
MPIPNPNPEASTTRPESNQSMPSQEGASLVDGTSEREYDIISDGDLVLIVGVDEKRIRITVQAARVCSHILGQILDQHNITDANNTGRVRELRLPDDSPTATRNAFGSIYPGNPHTDDLLPAEIYDVIVFARKYKMIPEFKKVTPNWFRSRFCGFNFHPVHLFFGLEECWHLMMAAHYMLLDDPNARPELHFAFSKLSERLMLTVLKSISTTRFVRPGGGMQRKWYSVIAWEALYHAPAKQHLDGVMEGSTCVCT